MTVAATSIAPRGEQRLHPITLFANTIAHFRTDRI